MIGCQAGMRLHQHAGDGAADSNGTEQLAQCLRDMEGQEEDSKAAQTQPPAQPGVLSRRVGGDPCAEDPGGWLWVRRTSCFSLAYF